MPATCSNCGTVNPDGNAFCTNCGRPIAPAPGAAAGAPPPPPPPAPAAQPLPPQAPVAYQAAPPPPPPPYAYYPQPAAPAQVHRMSGAVLIGAAVGLLALAGIGGAAFSLAGHKQGNVGPVVPTSAPTSAPTAAPTAVPTSAPTSAPTPQRTPTPAPTSTTKSTSGSTVTTGTFSAPLPSGWQVTKQDKVSANLQGQGAGVFIQAGTLNSPTTAQAQLSAVAKSISGKYPDATFCIKAQSGDIGDVNGVLAGFGYTLSTQGGQQVPVCDLYWFGTNAAGTVIYEFEYMVAVANAKTVANDVDTIVGGIRWTIQ